MVEEQKQRIETATTNMMNDIDKSFIRDLQAKMFQCSARCCEDKDSSVESVRNCIERCSLPVQKAQQYVQSEFDNFQSRIQRCVMGCNDAIADKMQPGLSEVEVSKYTREFEVCAKKCIDFHIDLMPNILNRMKHTLKQQKQ